MTANCLVSSKVERRSVKPHKVERYHHEAHIRCTTAIKCLMTDNQEVIGSSPIYALCVVAQLVRALYKQCTPVLGLCSVTRLAHYLCKIKEEFKSHKVHAISNKKIMLNSKRDLSIYSYLDL